jgi:hypothetical protein
VEIDRAMKDRIVLAIQKAIVPIMIQIENQNDLDLTASQT